MPLIKAGPKLRAGLRLVPEIGASSQTITATTIQVMNGVQRINRRLLTKKKIRKTRIAVMTTSHPKTAPSDQPAPGDVMPLWMLDACFFQTPASAAAPTMPPSICATT